MDFNLTPEQHAFRERVRHWVAGALPRAPKPPRSRHGESPESMRQRYSTWQRMRHEGGMACVLWPKEYGGQGLGVVEHYIVASEIDTLTVAPNINAVGFGMCLPLILHVGSPAQKARILPPAARGEAVWCQLFSEPGCGSDLASVKTRAEPEGKGWRLTGQKIWNSFAHHADFGICIARTDFHAPKHRGLTMFLLNVRQKGVTVRPVPFSNGDHDFNEVFLDGAWVDGEDVLGAVNDGWSVAISTLMIERGTSNIHVMFRPWMERVLALAKERLAADPAGLGAALSRSEIARLMTHVKIMELHGLRTLFGAASGAPPGPEGSLVKLMWSETNQRLAALALDVLGPAGALLDGDEAVPDEGWFPRNWLRSFGNTLEAGSSEVLRNIIAERMLGLPKDASRALPAHATAAQAPMAHAAAAHAPVPQAPAAHAPAAQPAARPAGPRTPEGRR
jgi:alkylation response protein AidB-like acyl-CoA dehydrogenase